MNSTWLRVSPHSRDRMADFRWPEKALSTRTKGQPGRAFGGVDAVLSPQKDQIFHFVSHVKDTCLALANVEHAVRDKTVLGKVGPHHHGGGIPLFNLEVDVGDSTVKSAGIGVLDITFHPGVCYL